MPIHQEIEGTPRMPRRQGFLFGALLGMVLFLTLLVLATCVSPLYLLEPDRLHGFRMGHFRYGAVGGTPNPTPVVDPLFTRPYTPSKLRAGFAIRMSPAEPSATAEYFEVAWW
jgi:hypothetical protein